MLTVKQIETKIFELLKKKDLSIEINCDREAAKLTEYGFLFINKKVSITIINITNIGVFFLSKLNIYEIIILNATNLTNYAFTLLPRSLKKINIAHCDNLTDEGISHIGRIQLLSLRLLDCKKITDKVVYHLAKTPLIEIYISNCYSMTGGGFILSR